MPQQPQRHIPSSLERKLEETRIELENIKKERHREKKERERAEKAQEKIEQNKKRASERDRVRKGAFEEIRPHVDQYLRTVLRDSVLAAQESSWKPRRIWSGYEPTDSSFLPQRASPRLGFGGGRELDPIFEEFSRFLQSRCRPEGQWLDTMSVNGGSLYNPINDSALQGRLEAAINRLLPPILMRMQQATDFGAHSYHGYPTRVRDFQAEADELTDKILQSMSERAVFTGSQHTASPAQESFGPRNEPRVHKPNEGAADSGYGSVEPGIGVYGNGSSIGQNSSRAGRKTKNKKTYRAPSYAEYNDNDKDNDNDNDNGTNPPHESAPPDFVGFEVPEAPRNPHAAWRGM